MGYIHCCGALHKTRTFRLAPYKDFLICEVDLLTRCPVCGSKVIQLTRITEKAEISCVRRTNAKADAFNLPHYRCFRKNLKVAKVFGACQMCCELSVK